MIWFHEIPIQRGVHRCLLMERLRIIDCFGQ
jgi:hypothetical protein